MNIRSGISLPGGTKIVATGADARLRVVDADTVNGTGEHPAIDSRSFLSLEAVNSNPSIR